jgi:hypothetical protein
MPRQLRRSAFAVALGALVAAALLIPAAPAAATYGCPGFPPQGPLNRPGGVCFYSDAGRLYNYQSFARGNSTYFYPAGGVAIRVVQINSTNCGISFYYWAGSHETGHYAYTGHWSPSQNVGLHSTNVSAANQYLMQRGVWDSGCT